MTSSEVEAVLREAEQAYAAVLERPADSVAREKLRSYLATIAAPTVAPGQDVRSGSIQGLPRQVSIMADIVRGRIERIRSKRRSLAEIYLVERVGNRDDVSRRCSKRTTVLDYKGTP